ncbi:type VII secretion protein EccE [Dactylosporangium sp. NBC_01737]|uniref:type VII secretion protein EccE n=1 Tax=Dactylosporangium sp. NBC_01737 TaxID=2975959 RepID=UPI002E15B5B9|nr:type VII secretion protein EccE [Dactylosporangium sp. NBC_01737]
MTSATAQGRPPATGPRPTPGGRPPDRTTPVRRLRPAPGGPGEFGTAQLVAIEVSAVAVGAAVFAGGPVAFGVGAAVAAGALAVGLSRSGGRWAYQTLGLRAAMRRRRNAGPAALPAPAFKVYGYDDRGTQLGVGQDRDGWFIAIAVGGAEEILGHRRPALRLDRLLRLLDEGTARPSALQLVSLRTAAPAGGPAPNSPAAASYRELLALTTGRQTGPAAHLTWVAARLDAADAIEAAADRGGGVDGVHRALAAMAGRLGKALNTAGVTYQILDPAALTGAVHAACGLDGLPAGAPLTARERWQGWLAAGRQQIAFEVEHWPVPFDPAAVQALMTIPAGQLVVSVVAARRGTEIGLRTVVRVIATPERLAAAVGTVREYTKTLGIRLRPMHGQHQPAVYASAPTGGGML